MTEEQYYEKGFELADVFIKKPLTAAYAGLPRNGSVFQISGMSSGMAYVFFNKYNRRWYLLSAALGEHLLTQNFVLGLYQAHLFHGLEQNGNEFIAIVTVGGDKSDSLLEIMEEAKFVWYERSDVDGLISFNKQQPQGRPGKYEYGFSEIMKQAFRGRYIDSPDNPVIVNCIK